MSVMTAVPPEITPVPQPPAKTKLRFVASDGSRAAALLSQLPVLEAIAKEANDNLDACKKAIQAEVAMTVSDASQMPDGFIIAEDPYGAWPAYNLVSNPGKMSVDTKSLREEDPDMYERHLKQGKPYWTFSRVQRNRVKR